MNCGIALEWFCAREGGKEKLFKVGLKSQFDFLLNYLTRVIFWLLLNKIHIPSP